jgi:3',5'-cyclic AMP phosphodiesterase CpdA
MPSDLRIVFASDIHLSRTRAFYQDNWDMVVEWIDRERPDCVVVGGDVVLTDPDETDDHKFAREQLDRIPVPWRVIPGNHDIGDNIVSGAMDKRFNAERRQRWMDHFGIDYWRHDVGEWTLIGVNAQALNSGLPEDDEQHAWLIRTVDAIDARRPIALFLHKPLFVDHPGETAIHQHCLEGAARRRLLEPFACRQLRIVASGHKHQYRAFGHDEVIHVWAPATSAVNSPPDVKMWGLREVGFVEFRLGQGAELGRVRQSLRGRDFLFRHEAYIRVLEYGDVVDSPLHPLR